MTTSTTACLTARDLAWAPAPTAPLLLDGINLTLGGEGDGHGRHLALVGDNGSGKTTLVRLLAGELSPTRGTVTCAGRLALLRQQGIAPTASIADGLGCGDTLGALGRLLAGDGTADDAERVGDRWGLLDDAERALGELGVAWLAGKLDRPLASLSGGEQVRVRLAGLSLQAADLWILDEPSNHLDRAGRDALLDALTTAPPTLIVTHDDELLERVDTLLELRGGQLHTTRGGLQGFISTRALETAAAERALHDARKEATLAARRAQERREKQDQRDAAGRRRRKAGGVPKIVLNGMKEQAGQTRARTKKLDDDRAAAAKARLEAAHERVSAQIDLSAVIEGAQVPSGKTVAEAIDLCWRPAPDAPPVLDGVSLTLQGAARIALLGGNGSGKSTLLSLLRGARSPASGTLTIGVPRVAFLDQHLPLPAAGGTVLDNLRAAAPTLPMGAARERLAAFLFWGESVHQDAAVLSGGERLRLSLCCAVAEDERGPPQLLLLDEPTNHLDRRAREGLAAMLRTWPGALVVASHDHRWLQTLALDEVIALPSGERSSWTAFAAETAGADQAGSPAAT
jgi:ATPase subunit of ABC transporter with duplicated ATPase domains